MTDPVLDFATLLAPIPGDEPAGKGVPYTLRQKLRAERKDTEPHPDDPSQPNIPRKVDWPGIKRICQETLTNTSKDLEIALHLVEAVTKLHQFAGLRDGLVLLRGMITECWDRMHPIPEEGEGMEIRAERFHWLSEVDRGVMFPIMVKNLPVIKIDGLPYSLQDRNLAQEGRGSLPASDFERSVPINDNVFPDLTQALLELGSLEQSLQERFGNDSPSLMGLRQAMEEYNTFLQFVCRNQTPAQEAESAEGAAQANGSAVVAGGGRAGAMVTREDAYRQLSDIADFLARLEPHSPIPDLLHRAIELGRMPFRQLIHELVREPNLLAEIRREFGIKEATG